MFKSLPSLYQDAKQNNGGFINYLLINSRGEFGYTFSRITADSDVVELTSVYYKDNGNFGVVINYIDETTEVDADGFFSCINTDKVTQLMPFIDGDTDMSIAELYEEPQIFACMVRNRICKQIVKHSKLLSNLGKAKLMCVFADHFVTNQNSQALNAFATKAFDVYRNGLIVGEYSTELVDAIEDELQAITEQGE